MNADASITQSRFEIGGAGLFDLPAIRRLEQACFARDAYDIMTLLGLMLSTKTMRMKAAVGGRLVGFVAAEVQGRGDLGWIITIGVLPDFQARGIGRMLLSSVEQGLRVKRVRLTVRQSNHRAIALYNTAGYRWISTSPRYYHDGEDGLIMGKEMW